MPEKITDRMRPCVKDAFEKGARDRDHLKKMTFAIIYELNRLGNDRQGIKMALLKWNKKGYKKLAPRDAQRQLCDYVDWFFTRETKLSCHALKDYCTHENGGCSFAIKPNTAEIEMPFPLNDAMVYLEREYRPQGYLMGILVRAIYAIQREKNAKNILYVGLRTIQAKINDEYRHALDLMTILRALNELERAGILRITHGQRGTFGTRRANGYSFLPWKPPIADNA